MHAIVEAACAGRGAPTLVVMLPAAYSGPEDFVRAGFVRAVRSRHLDIDLVFAGLELQHATDRTLLTRLRQELILPARSQGSSIWLGGISLGAYIALCCAERHPQEIDGLCVFAPYLGSHIVTGEIARANGVHAWRPGELAEDDEERRVWRFIQTQGSRSLPIHLGLGREDRFAERHRLMASALAPGSVDIVPGGHDWPTWYRLWENFLDARLVPHA
ncbi:MAG TPA: alpha/beta hydrolase-fold protein [Steroidobacteraceae bacterium]